MFPSSPLSLSLSPKTHGTWRKTKQAIRVPPRKPRQPLKTNRIPLLHGRWVVWSKVRCELFKCCNFVDSREFEVAGWSWRRQTETLGKNRPIVARTSWPWFLGVALIRRMIFFWSVQGLDDQKIIASIFVKFVKIKVKRFVQERSKPSLRNPPEDSVLEVDEERWMGATASFSSGTAAAEAEETFSVVLGPVWGERTRNPLSLGSWGIILTCLRLTGRFALVVFGKMTEGDWRWKMEWRRRKREEKRGTTYMPKIGVCLGLFGSSFLDSPDRGGWSTGLISCPDFVVCGMARCPGMMCHPKSWYYLGIIFLSSWQIWG